MNTNRMTMKEARNNTGMAVSTACAAMQISREKLLSWESGRSLPAVDEAIRMAAVYGLKLNDIDFSRTKMEITLANKFLKMTEKEQTTLLAIMEMVSGNQARREFAERWTGKMEDLPAALAQI